MDLEGRRWISPKEASKYLSLHLMTIYQLIYADKLPAVRIGRSVRVDLKALEAMLEAQVESRPTSGRMKGRDK